MTATTNPTTTPSTHAEVGAIDLDRLPPANRIGYRLTLGEKGALEDCYRHMRPLLLSTLRRRLPREDAEEVMQTTMFEVWRSAGRYDPSRSFEAWVMGIARKRLIDHLRRRRPETVALEHVEAFLPAGPEDAADFRVQGMHIRDALTTLPDEQRVVLELAYFGGLTQQEIAAQLATPLGTVKARTFRGLRRLRAGLEAVAEAEEANADDAA